MIVFDLDGTLVDSRPEIVDAMEHAWRAVIGDVPFPRERFRIGPPLAEAIAALSPSLAPKEREALAVAFRDRYDASDFSSTLPYPGLRDAIDALAARGTRLAIATNKRLSPTRAILGRWFPERFPHGVCIDGVWPDDGTRPDRFDGPPHGAKAAMLAWLARLPKSPAAAVMIGDSANDVAAARAVGWRSVAVTWGYEDASALVAARPDELVHDVASLLAALERVRAARPS